MSASIVPQTFPATGVDTAVSITRKVTQHRIGLRLVFAGRLDPDRLARSVRLSVDAEPVLGCSFEVGSHKASWRRLADLDAALPFRILDTDDPDAVHTTFQAAGIADTGPQVAVALVRTASHDELGVKISHVLGDGQAAKRYAYLLADLYTRLGADPSYAPEPNLRARPTAIDVWDRLTPTQRSAAKKAKSWAIPNWEVRSKAVTGEGLTFRIRTLPPERFSILRAYGKARGSTVNDMMLAAFFRACTRAFDPPCGVPLSLMCTADLRRYLPDADTLPIANISISGSLDIERVADEDFDGTLSRVKERMGVWADACYGAGPAKNAEKLASLGYGVTKVLLEIAFKSGRSGKSYPWFTNIGVIDEARLSFGGVAPVAGHMFGPSAFGPSIVPTISTYRGALAMCMGLCDQDIDVEIVENVLTMTFEELDAVTTGPGH